MEILKSNLLRAATRLLYGVLICASGCVSASTVSPPTAIPVQDLIGLQDRVRLVTLPQEVALVRDVTGSHRQHAAVFAELFRYASQRYPGTQAPFGVYPDDPDVVGADEARWSVGVVLREGGNTKGIDAPDGTFRLVVLPPRLAFTLESTMANARVDGLMLYAWVPLSGYVQTAPTRMDYLDPSADKGARVRIVVPVRQRSPESK